MIANMIQTQFMRLNNAPLGAALAVMSMATVAIISIAFVLLTRRWGRTK
jgi:spermidine/putrescine transport system permease protein